jgi:hypothetical protein
VSRETGCSSQGSPGTLVVVITPIGGLFVLLIAAAGDRHAALALSIEPDGLA